MATQHLAYAGASDWLNRLSWLRTNSAFLNRALTSTRARFLVLRNLDPLVVPASATSRELAFLTYADVQTHIHKDHFADEPGTASQPNLSDRPLVVFLGVDERAAGGHFLPDSHQSYDTADAYFALDATSLPQLLARAQEKAGPDAEFLELRSGGALLPREQLATAAIARALIDWHRRNPYCAGCGRKTVDVQAGWKRFCPPDSEPDRPPCPTRKGVHNISFPRTDAVIIVAVLHPTEDKILLGRQKAWPKDFYSVLAGFLEPAESLDEAVKREIWEEAAIAVKNVTFHSTQPWPFPGSLMIGAFAQATNTDIRTDLDNELEDARWVSREAVLGALSNEKQTTLTREESAEMHAKYGTDEASGHVLAEEKLIRLPPKTAIAHTLVSAWANREFQVVDKGF